MITLHIQLRSKVEMPFEEAIDYIQDHFPGFLTSTGGGYSPREGMVHLNFRQDALSDEQRDWLHLSSFSAVYIDGYTMEKLPVIPIAWGVSEDGVPEDEDEEEDV